MTITRRGNGYALNGDANELMEVLRSLEGYIEQDALWAHNSRQRPAMKVKAAGYRKLHERLAELNNEHHRVHQFTVDETTYETRVSQSDDGYYVRIFKDDNPVSPTYSVTGQVGDELKEYTGMDPVSELVEMAEGDLKENLKRRPQ